VKEVAVAMVVAAKEEVAMGARTVVAEMEAATVVVMVAVAAMVRVAEGKVAAEDMVPVMVEVEMATEEVEMATVAAAMEMARWPVQLAQA